MQEALAEAGGEINEEVRTVFRDEMLKLGHEERVRNLYRVRDKLTAKAVFFLPNEPQDNFMKTRKGRDISLKTRQVGMTTQSTVRGLDKTLWDENMQSGIMAHLQTVVKTIFEDLVKFTYDWFKRDWGDFYAPVEKADSASALSFSEDGLGRPLNSSMRVLFDFRGKTVNFLHVSEAAFIDNKRLLGSLQAVPISGEIVLESTPNGRGGDFYNQWQNHKKLGSLAPYKGHFVPWFTFYPEQPENFMLPEGTILTQREIELREAHKLEDHHIAWRRWCIAANCQGDEEKFENEYPSNDIDCFFTGESLVFSSTLLKQIDRTCRLPSNKGFLLEDGPKVKFHADSKGITSIWQEPKPGNDYVIGADTSSGVGKDLSVAYVKNRTNKTFVAKVEGYLEPKEFSKELMKLGRYFNNAFICPEENNHGHVVIQCMKDARYANIYRRKVIDEMTNKPTKKLGFLTTNDTKLMITEQFKDALTAGEAIVLDFDLLDEMSSFTQFSSKNGGRTIRREALPGKTDDRVIAACLTEEMDRNRGVAPDNEKSEASPSSSGGYDPETGFAVGS